MSRPASDRSAPIRAALPAAPAGSALVCALTRASLAGALTLALLPGLAAAQGTGTAASVERPLPPGFRRPVLLVYPLVDQRGLGPDGAPRPEPPAWRAALAALASRPNLSVSPPARTLARQTGRAGHAAALQLARQAAARGAEDHRRVRLDSAVRELEGALSAFATLEHDLLAPDEVGAVALLQAQALQEAGRPAEAAAAYARALRIAPRLRLRPGVDSPAAIEALEAARRSLASERPPPPDAFVNVPDNLGANTHVLRARVVDDLIEITVQSAGGLRVDQQRLDDPEAGDRLAARLWACLPYGRAPVDPGPQRELHLDAGFHFGVYANAPAVDWFTNLGVGLNTSLLVAPNLTLNAGLTITNSDRDRNEDLREDLSAVRLYAGPGFAWRSDRVRLGASLGLEAATVSDVVVTRNVACKHFSPEDGLPPALCDPERNVARTDRAWQVGAAVNLSLGVRLVDRFALITHLSTATYIYESLDSGLGLPVGVQFALGYQVF